MKILFLTPQLPYPPRQGTQIRNYHLLKSASTAHHVDLLSFARPEDTIENAGPLTDLCGEIHLVPAPRRTQAERLRLLLGSRDPDMAYRLRSDGFTATLRRVLSSNRYDLIQIEGIELAAYLPIIREAAPQARVLFDDHNAEYLLQGRAAFVDLRNPPAWPKAIYSLIQWQRLKRYEGWICREADTVLAVSGEDAAALQSLGTAAQVAVVPNGVDTAFYRPDPSTAREPATILFTGTMDFRPNVDAIRWFVLDVLPLVARHAPHIRVEIVGRSPSPAIRALESRKPEVTIAGPVEDIRPYFARAGLFVVPMRMGGGVRLKILEALAAGVPLVSTSMGAEGTGLAHEKELLLADSAEGFAQAILRLLDDETLRLRLSKAGRQAVESRFDWDCIAPRLLSVYEGLKGASTDGASTQ